MRIMQQLFFILYKILVNSENGNKLLLELSKWGLSLELMSIFYFGHNLEIILSSKANLFV